LGAFVTLLCREGAASPPRALVIGSNQGLASEPILEFAEQDARRTAQIFSDVAGMQPARVHLLVGRPLVELRAALRALAQDRPEEVWLFVSGHADARGLHVRGEIWPWRELREALEQLPVERRLGLVDACNSGAVLTAKGISFENRLQLKADPEVRGLALLTSSGSNELSYESRRLSGSPFAHFLGSGLRGAADENRDGVVTLAELYTYLYARTVAASLGGQEGPQHPTQAGWYQGQGEWKLTQLRRSAAALRLGDERLGQCFVLDPAETAVVAEVRASDPGPVQVAVGRYRIKCISGDEAFVASADLHAGTTAVESLAFASTERHEVVARGPALDVHRRLALSGGVSTEQAGPEAWATLGYVHDFGVFSAELQVGLSHVGRFAPKLGIYGHLPWWTVLGTRLDVGLSTAYRTTFEDAGDLTFGPLVQLSLEAGPRLRVFLREEIQTSVSLSAPAENSLPLLTTAGMDFSFDQ
jgi:hypothetical protein